MISYSPLMRRSAAAVRMACQVSALSCRRCRAAVVLLFARLVDCRHTAPGGLRARHRIRRTPGFVCCLF